jgi:hypothetical protein
MPYQLTAQAKPGYLHVLATGENSPQAVADYITEVGKLCVEKKQSIVLIEENLQGPGLSMFDIFKVIKSLRQAPQLIRWIVYVDANPAHDPFMMDFAKNLAVSRGLRVHLCRSVAEAEEWIRTMVL